MDSAVGSMHAYVSTPKVDPMALPFVPVSLPTGLTMDGLMTWLGQTLGTTDAQLQDRMSKMTDAKNQQGALQSAIENLRGLKIGAGTDGKCPLPDSFKTGAYQNEDWYKSLPKTAQQKIDALVGSAAAFQDDEIMSAGVAALGISPGDQWKLASGGTVVGPDGKTYTGDDVRLAGRKDLLSKGLAYDTGGGGLTKTTGDLAFSTDKIDEAIKDLDGQMSDMSSGNEMDMIKLQSAVSARAQMIQMISNVVHSMDDTTKQIVGNVR
jgi:hypothetical protein